MVTHQVLVVMTYIAVVIGVISTAVATVVTVLFIKAEVVEQQPGAWECIVNMVITMLLFLVVIDFPVIICCLWCWGW